MRAASSLGLALLVVGAIAAGTLITARAGEEEIPAGALRPGRDGVTALQRIRAPQPRYPERAAEANIAAEVVVVLRVDTEGEVAEARAVSCSVPYRGFEAAAVDAVRNWRFQPALLANRPVEVWDTLTVRFVPPAVIDKERLTARMRSFGQASLAQLKPGELLAGRDGVSRPAREKWPLPDYPGLAWRHRIGAHVLVFIGTGEDGSVSEIRAAEADRSDHPFREAVESAVRKWRYGPAWRGGTRVPVWFWVLVEFDDRRVTARDIFADDFALEGVSPSP